MQATTEYSTFSSKTLGGVVVDESTTYENGQIITYRGLRRDDGRCTIYLMTAGKMKVSNSGKHSAPEEFGRMMRRSQAS
jgi:hypothetical protein